MPEALPASEPRSPAAFLSETRNGGAGMTAQGPFGLHDATPGQACLSIASFVATCAYPPPSESEAAKRAWFAFIALLEARGHRVTLASHPGFQIRRRGWCTMTKARRNQIFDTTAYRLLSRRIAFIELRFRLAFRPATMSRERVRGDFGRVLAAGSRVAGRYERTNPTADNVRRIEREARPVMHLAYAIKAELDREELTAWDWPALALMEGAQERIRRMVAAAEVWRTALQRPALGALDDAGTVDAAEQIRVML